MHTQTKNVTVTTQKHWLNQCVICEASATDMFVYGSSTTMYQIIEKQELLIKAKLHKPTSSLITDFLLKSECHLVT